MHVYSVEIDGRASVGGAALARCRDESRAAHAGRALRRGRAARRRPARRPPSAASGSTARATGAARSRSGARSPRTRAPTRGAAAHRRWWRPSSSAWSCATSSARATSRRRGGSPSRSSNDRLALELQPDDDATLAHVQRSRARSPPRKAELLKEYRASFAAGDLASARRSARPAAHARRLRSRARDRGARARRCAALRGLASRSRWGGAASRPADYHRGAARLRRGARARPGQRVRAGLHLLHRHADARAQQIQAKSKASKTAAPSNFARRDTFASQAEIRAEGFYQNGLAAARRGDSYAAIRQQLFALGANAEHTAAQRELARLRRQLAPEVEKLIESGREAFRNEDLQSALDEWRLALLVDPENERTRAYIGHAERQLENLERMRSEPDAAARVE